ncbi:MAG TPA: competence/damage-inducible protein A [Solirubrobacteraceae bacterium]|nr:competence/damage-inducible protein A [Solirubrobacteraceae bacterium]
MSATPRAGILVTGTEVLTGRVRDRNGPWLSDRLRELGVDLAHTIIVGDRPQDMDGALRFMAGEGLELILTSGGLGPTADDLTAEVVGRFQQRELILDEPLEARITEIVRPLSERYPNLDREAIAIGTRKQAMVPRGATILDPVGTAPGLVVAPADGSEGPTVVVLPGPPRELQPMWKQAAQAPAFRAAIAGAPEYRQQMLRLFGIPESEIAETLREAERDGVDLGALEITTCLRGGEIEVVTRYEAGAQDAYDAFVGVVESRHADTLYSTDGTSIDEQVAALLKGVTTGSRAAGTPHTVAVAESCTGGLLLGRLTNPPGASAYVLGGIVVYSNDAKVTQAGVDPLTIEQHGAVSEQVAKQLATGARTRLATDIGIGVTGIAGPGGGSEEKPVGLVWFSVEGPDNKGITRSVRLPGGRADVRERAALVSMHLLRRLLLGESDNRPDTSITD